MQEAINNSVKHGRPSIICIKLTADASDLIIEIEDNGQASLPAKGEETGGLDNMRVRATLISATLLVSCNADTHGICVVLKIPLRENMPEMSGETIDEDQTMNNSSQNLQSLAAS